MPMQTLGQPKPVSGKNPRVFDIDIDTRGASDADIQVVADRYAANQFRRDIRDSGWRRFMSLLGLYNAPNEGHRHIARK